MPWDLILWTAFAASNGLAHGAVFAHGNNRHPYDVHWFFAPTRAIVLALCICLNPGIGGLSAIILMISLLLMFSFWHNGVYYETRRRLDFPAYRFWSQSSTTTSQLQYSFTNRSIQLLLGIFFYFVSHENIFSL